MNARLILLLALFAAAPFAFSQGIEPEPQPFQDVPLFHWSPDAGGNDHYYQVYSTPDDIAWPEAQKLAESYGGYLATITSQEENDFLGGLYAAPQMYNPERHTSGGWIGGSRTGDSVATVGEWTWENGEGPLDFSLLRHEFNVLRGEFDIPALYLSFHNRIVGINLKTDKAIEEVNIWMAFPAKWQTTQNFYVEYDSDPTGQAASDEKSATGAKRAARGNSGPPISLPPLFNARRKTAVTRWPAFTFSDTKTVRATANSFDASHSPGPFSSAVFSQDSTGTFGESPAIPTDSAPGFFAAHPVITVVVGSGLFLAVLAVFFPGLLLTRLRRRRSNQS